jgi:hypothetical protein
MRAQTSHTTRPYALAYFLERENASAHARDLCWVCVSAHVPCLVSSCGLASGLQGIWERVSNGVQALLSPRSQVLPTQNSC